MFENMRLTLEQQKEQQQKLVDLLRRVCDFFKKNNLRWWMAYGSALGTIRHHGFIPWDDDLDIFMPYEDYVRLLNMKDEFLGEDFALDIPFTDNNCCTYAKIYDTNSTVWQVESYESIIGLWIDIFPLFQSNMSLEEYKNAVSRFKKLSNEYIGGVRKPLWKDFVFLLKGGHVKTFMKWIKEMTYYKWKLNNTINETKTFLNSLNVSDGRFYIFPFSYSNVINRYPIEYFLETIEMPFENIMVKMASGYDKILRQQYGDYMTFPPIEERITHHSYYFIDLNRKVSKDEIKKKKNLL